MSIGQISQITMPGTVKANPSKDRGTKLWNYSHYGYDGKLPK